MPLPSKAYPGETITNSDGKEYTVIDTSAVDFSGPEVKFGKKTRPMLVKIGKPGEVIYTRPGGHDETPAYTAIGGEAIFINDTPNGTVDAFVPRDSQGNSIGLDILATSYELIGGDIHGDGAYYRPNGKAVPILHEVIDRHSVIKNAYGEGQHAFFSPGATLKCDNGNVSGIDKVAFDFTWKETDALGRILEDGKAGTIER